MISCPYWYCHPVEASKNNHVWVCACVCVCCSCEPWFNFILCLLHNLPGPNFYKNRKAKEEKRPWGHQRSNWDLCLEHAGSQRLHKMVYIHILILIRQCHKGGHSLALVATHLHWSILRSRASLGVGGRYHYYLQTSFTRPMCLCV